jgi:RND family efflux transporter MFP subunit
MNPNAIDFMSTNIKRILWIGTCVAFVGVAVAVIARQAHDSSSSREAAVGSEQKALYTCGMHPQVIQDHPGNCPICAMKLTPIRKGPAAANESSSQAIAVDPATMQNMGIRTAMVARGPLRRAIRTFGVIEYNETALADVTTKFKGWIEKLYANATGQLVMRGDPLFEIYSPEIYSAQAEYLLATDSANKGPAGGDLLKAAALMKLKYFDVSDEQIAELDKSRQPFKTVRVLSQQDGFVIEKMAVAGQMVEAGMKTYRLADLGLVWVRAQIYEQDFPYLRLGQEATVTLPYLADREFRGRVTYIYPNVDEKTRTVQVRMEFHNPGYFLKPGMFATVKVSAELEPSALLIPGMAILRSGEKATVFVAKAGGTFEPRTVMLGPQGENDTYQVLAGVNEGERIVTSGQFMLDSESQLREAIQKMMNPKVSGEVAPGSPEVSSSANLGGTNLAGLSAADLALVKYICPMPEHVSIEYDHPGKCPICGMVLVPVTAATLQKLQPGGRLLHYTCPMPEHSDVQTDKPGNCSKCGMTLIPVMEAPPLPGRAAGMQTLYTCPMAAHADVVSDKPGKCTKCEMELVPTSSVAHGKIAEEHWRKGREGVK